MQKYIRLNFVDFWPNFKPTSTYLYNILKTKYTLEITDKPDFLIYSVFGREYKKYKCIRILYTGENIRPDFSECDYAFSFDYMDNPNNYRLPLYATYCYPPEKLVKKGLDVEQILQSKTKFCNFVYSKSAIIRDNFFHKLSRYKRVDSGGRFMNNIGGPMGDKLAFIKDYKFTIAFENSAFPGYTTEKLVHPMLVHSLAIYWGNELVQRDFNPKSFLNYHDFEDEDELIQRIIEVDQNDELYMEYLKQPYFHNNTVNEYINPENILKQFAYIFDNVKKPVALKRAPSNIRIGRRFHEEQYLVNPGFPKCSSAIRRRLRWGFNMTEIAMSEAKTLINKPDPVILELGAHIGSDSQCFLNTFPQVKLFCFEPDFRCIRKFKQNIKDERCQLIEAAISDIDGKVTLLLSGGQYPDKSGEYTGSSSIKNPLSHLKCHPYCTFEESTTVEAIRLDTWYDESNLGIIDFIWADVQGAEENMIKGGINTLNNTRYLYTEFSDSEMYEGQINLETIMRLLPNFEMVYKYSYNVLLRNKILTS